WHSTKAVFRNKDEMSKILGLPPEEIYFHQVHMGGDFGGKGAPGDAPAAYYLAKMTGQPIKFVTSYSDELTAGTPRHPAYCRLKNAPRDPDGSQSEVPGALLRAAADAVGWGTPKRPFVGRGIGIAQRNMGGGPGSADLTVNPDGSVTAISAAPDVGTGTLTVV